MKFKKITKDNIFLVYKGVIRTLIQKGIFTNLIGIGAALSMFPNREQERLERMAQREMDRADRMREMRRKKRLSGRRK